MTVTLTEPKVQLGAHVYGALQLWAASHLTLAFLCFILQARNGIVKKYLFNTNEGRNRGSAEQDVNMKWQNEA